MVDRVVEHLFNDQMDTTAGQRPVGATDRQQQRRRFTAVGEGSEIVLSAIARKLRHEFGCRWNQALLVALAGNRQPSSVLAVAIAPPKKTANRIAHDFRDTQTHQIQDRDQPANACVVLLLPYDVTGHRVD